MSLVQQIRQTTIDTESRRASNAFAALGRYMLAAGASGLGGALELAKSARATDQIQTILRSAVTAGSTTNTSALVGYASVAEGFVESLKHESAFQFMLSAGSFRTVPFRTALALVSLSATGSSVGELQPKPITRLSVSADLLDRELKAVAILVVSNELQRFSGPAGATLFANELRRAVGVAVDEIFFAELLDTSTPSVPSSGNSAADGWSDLQFLFGSVPLTGQSAPYLVGGPLAIRSLALRSTAGQAAFPDCGVSGGTVAGVPVLVSDGVAEDQLVLLDAARVIVADSGVTLDSSQHATLPLSDDGTGAPSSLFQQNATALKCERLFAVHPMGDCAASVTSVGAS